MFTIAALEKVNKGPIIAALVKSKANEEALSKTILANRKKLADVAAELKKGLAENANDTIKMASLNTGIMVIEGLDWTSVPEIIEEKATTSKLESRETRTLKLDANTPVFSNKPGERLDEWLFVLNNAFDVLNIADDQKLGLATTYVKGPVLQSLIRFKKEELNPTWEGFTKLLKTLYEPRNQEMQLRTLLRRIRQGDKADSFQRYLNKFQDIINQLPNMSLDEQYVAFVDGLSDTYKHEVMRNPSCKTLTEAIRITSDYDFCMNANKKEGVSVNYINKLHESTSKKFTPHSSPRFNRTNRKWSGPRKESNNNNNFEKKFDSKKQDLSKVTCHKCKKMGHYANTCRANIKRVNVASVIKETNVDSLLTVAGKINGVALSLALDSGATACILSSKIAKRYKFNVIESDVRVKVADGEVVQIVGITEPVTIDVQGHSCTMEMYVMEHDDHDALLGLSWFMATGAGIFPGEGILRFHDEIVRLESNNSRDLAQDETIYMSEFVNDADAEDIEGDINWSLDGAQEMRPVEALDHDQKKKFEKLKNFVLPHFAKSLADLGSCDLNKFEIVTTTEQPIFVPAYRKSAKEQEEIKEEISKLLEAGIIRPSNSAWSAPIILVPKKDGTRRFCVDYRKLNAITVTENFPLPVIRDILDRLMGSNWFSQLDLKAGFMQIVLAPSAIPKTAFSTPQGAFEFVKLGFGLKNAPAHFSRIMAQVLGNFDFVQIYLDDMTIHSKTFDEHIMHIKMVLNALKKANLKLNQEKCTWFAKSLKVLGHVVTGSTVSMDPAKIAAIKERVAPKTVKQVQQFLGICNYYRRFIKNFSEICSPLFQLLQKDRKWEWSEIHDKAFNEMKLRLTEYPILRHPDLSKPFMVHTDASSYAIGAILSQKDGDSEYVCAYESRIFKGAEVHYGITEKECLAVVFAIKKFRVYLHGQRFEVITDHSALNWLMTINDPQGRLARWAIMLQSYDFKITHKAGKAHTNVDAVSRPVLPVIDLIIKEPEEENEHGVKSLDAWEDIGLLHFLKYRRHSNGASSKQVRRIEKLFDHFKLEGDTLFYRKNISDLNFLKYPKLEERAGIVLKAHLLGHFQLATTLDRVKAEYYWKNMGDDVAKIINKCLTCQRHQKVPAVYHPAIAIEVDGIFDQIGIDLVFGLPETKDGYIGLFCIMERTTKFPFVFPIKSKSMNEMSVCLLFYISIFGPPKEILSDQGTEFNNKLVAKLLQATGIEHRVTSAYNPRTNGMTERFNQTLVQSLRKHAEENPLDWDKWIPYVLLAYRSRVHTSTKFSPFELVFGRKMNKFENWISSPSNNEIASLSQRANEIRQLVEHTRSMAKINTRNSQEKQKIIQDNQNNVDLNVLVPGTSVFIKNEGIISKLSPRYSGPYKVVRVTSSGNYVLENALQELVKMSYPRHKLKLVADLETEDSINLEVEKILDHKKVNDQMIYLVKWKNSDDTDWLPVDNFNTMEVINEYHKRLETKMTEERMALRPRTQQRLLREAREENLRVRPNLISNTRENQQTSNYNINNAVSEPIRRRRGRPPKSKIVVANLLVITMIMAAIFALAIGKEIEINANVMYCDSGEGNFLNLENSCIDQSEIDKPNLQLKPPQFSNEKPFYILDKMRHLVSGEAFECLKEKHTIKTFRDLFRRDSMESRIENLQVTKEECDYLRRTKMCIDTEMVCENNICSTSNVPVENYAWLREISDSVINCVLHKRFISADDENSVVFGNHNCVAKNGFCRLTHSLIIWDINTIHRCAYYLVTTINATMLPGEILFSKSVKLAFIITGNLGKIGACNDIYFLTSAEGLFITQDKSVHDLPKIMGDTADISKLILSDYDADKYESSTRIKKLHKEVCIGIVNTLNILKVSNQKYFKLIDYKNNVIILYTKYNHIWVPKCFPIKKFILKQISSNENCSVDLPVEFNVGNVTIGGYLETNNIIKNDTTWVTCTNLEQLFFLEGNTIKRVGKRMVIIPNSTIISHNTILNMKSFNISRINFLHSKLITDGNDFSSEFSSILLNDDLHAEEKYTFSTNFVKSQHIFSIYWENVKNFVGDIKHYIYSFLFIILGIIIVYILFTLKIFHMLFSLGLVFFITTKNFLLGVKGSLNRYLIISFLCLRNLFVKKTVVDKHGGINRQTIYKAPTFATMLLEENKLDLTKVKSVKKVTENDANVVATSILLGDYK